MIREDEVLHHDWLAELAEVRGRINGLRAELAAAGRVGAVDLSSLSRQYGMFSQLPLTPTGSSGCAPSTRSTGPARAG